jgi:hypothetical protein
MRILLPIALLSLAALLVDWYVYRNWRRFAVRRPRARWTLPVYRVLMAAMPLVLPLYFSVSNWWSVEPKAVRFVVVGLWLTWYVPKGLIALALALKDAARFVMWLFAWFKRQPALVPDDGPEEERRVPLDLTDMKRISRGEFLRQMGWTAASVPFVLVGYSVFRGLYDFDVTRVDVPIPGLPRAFDGLRIAQLSDLHAGSLFSAKPMEEAIDLVLAETPDLVTITGDYVNHDAAETSLILPALDRLRAHALRRSHRHARHLRR